MPTRYIVIGVLSIIMGIVFLEIAEKYNHRTGEILSIDMVFTLLVFCIMVVLEGIYQTIYWFYGKNSR